MEGTNDKRLADMVGAPTLDRARAIADRIVRERGDLPEAADMPRITDERNEQDAADATYEWCAVWHDSLGLSRAYGCAPTQDAAERVADEEAIAYKRGRPDVELVYRETHKLDTSGEYRRVARFG